MVYRSYTDWNHAGRYVKKGEKAAAKTKDGVYLFHKKQTKKYKQHRYTTSYTTCMSSDCDPNMEDWENNISLCDLGY
jgi:hypothetical protein